MTPQEQSSFGTPDRRYFVALEIIIPAAYPGTPRDNLIGGLLFAEVFAESLRREGLIGDGDRLTGVGKLEDATFITGVNDLAKGYAVIEQVLERHPMLRPFVSYGHFCEQELIWRVKHLASSHPAVPFGKRFSDEAFLRRREAILEDINGRCAALNESSTPPLSKQ